MDNVAAADILDGCFRNAFDYGRMDLAAPAPARDDPPFRTLPMELERWLYGSDSFETELRQWERQRVGSNRPKLTGGELVDLTAFVAAQGALRGLPDVLGVVIAVCRKGAVQAGARSKGGGNRQDTFSTELFIGFARAHEVLFDCKPRYRDNNREPEGPAVAWVRRLLEIAKERTPIAFVGDAAPLIAC